MRIYRFEVADLLRQAGHDGTNPVEQYLDGEADADVAVICRREGRALVTLDKGFNDPLAYPPEQLSGRIVLRPGGKTNLRCLRFSRA